MSVENTITALGNYKHWLFDGTKEFLLVLQGRMTVVFMLQRGNPCLLEIQTEMLPAQYGADVLQAKLGIRKVGRDIDATSLAMSQEQLGIV